MQQGGLGNLSIIIDAGRAGDGLSHIALRRAAGKRSLTNAKRLAAPPWFRVELISVRLEMVATSPLPLMLRFALMATHYLFPFVSHLVARGVEQPTDTKESRFKTWAYAIFIWAFMCVWLSGMTAGLMAGACRKDQYEGTKKLRFCNISLIAGAWTKFSSLEKARGAIIQLERGIALAQLGETEAAVGAFGKALRDAKAKSGTWERELHQRMAQIEDRSILALWVSVVNSAN